MRAFLFIHADIFTNWKLKLENVEAKEIAIPDFEGWETPGDGGISIFGVLQPQRLSMARLGIRLSQ